MREIYYVKSVDNSRLVPVLDPRASRQYLTILFLAAVGFSAILTSAWKRFDGIEDGYRLEALQGEKQRILEANRKLRLEEAYLGDPVRIDAIARNELGMNKLSATQIVAGEPTTPSADASIVADAGRRMEPFPSSLPSSLPSEVKHFAAVVP